MKVTNNTSYQLIAFGWDKNYGSGKEVSISPGESVEIKGPYIGEMGGGSCYAVLGGQDIVCHESPDDKSGFHVSKCHVLNLGKDTEGVMIRHYLDAVPFLLPV